VSNTAINLHKAMMGEAKARLEYAAFAQQALKEGHPEIAQVFNQAAEDVTLHGSVQLQVAGGTRTTQTNLEHLIYDDEEGLTELYPRFIREAEEEGEHAAAAAFRQAIDREQQHLAMFKETFDRFS
jgi:rubrerythrin